MSDGVRIAHASRSVRAIVASIGSRDRRVDRFTRWPHRSLRARVHSFILSSSTPNDRDSMRARRASRY